MKILFTSKYALEALDVTKRQLVTMLNEPNDDYDQPVIVFTDNNTGQVHFGDKVYDIDVNGPMFATDDLSSVKVTLLATAN